MEGKYYTVDIEQTPRYGAGNPCATMTDYMEMESNQSQTVAEQEHVRSSDIVFENNWCGDVIAAVKPVGHATSFQTYM